MHSLFRDSGMLRAAARRTERVLDDQSAKKRISGVAELSLVVGVATWKGNKMPVLLYPVEVVRDGTPVENHTTITFTGHVRLNSAFLNAMRENGVNLDERALFDGSNYASGTPETAAVFAVITKAAQQVFADFSIERQIILGCFVDPIHTDPHGKPHDHRAAGTWSDQQCHAQCPGRLPGSHRATFADHPSTV